MNLEDIYEICADEHEMLAYLQDTKLLKSQNKCNKCKKICSIYKRRSRYFFRCPKCRKNFPTAPNGCFFHNSHVPYDKVLQLIYFFLHDMSQYQCKEMLKISSRTIVYWYNQLREVCEIEIFNSKCTLGGPGKVVEIEESPLGGRKYNKGLYIKCNWVIRGIERGGTQNHFVVPVENTTSEIIKSVLEKYVAPGSTVITDEWKGYKKLNEMDLRHLKENHSLLFEDSKTGAHTNTIKEWAQIKSKLPIRGRHDNIFHSHLCAYLWKKKNEGPNIFLNFMEVLRKQNSKEEPDVRTTLLKVKQFNSVYNKNKTTENSNTLEEPKINNGDDDDKLNDNNQTDLDK